MQNWPRHDINENLFKTNGEHVLVSKWRLACQMQEKSNFSQNGQNRNEKYNSQRRKMG